MKLKTIILLIFTFITLGIYSQTAVIVPTLGTTNNQNAIVGNIKGSYSTSPSGAMLYSIPLIIPQGAGGMKPNLSLVYNSQGGNGHLGMGWSLSGMGAITRMPKNWHNDGKVEGIKLNTSDLFALNGQRLNAISGVYGANNTKYATEVESYSEITSHAATNANAGPNYFTVRTKDGLVYKYGNNINSRIIGANYKIIWLLTSITNAEGYRIEYIYNCRSSQYKEPYISYITYSKRGSSMPQYKILFSWENRIDNNVTYHAGIESELTKRLNIIDIKYFNYTTDRYESMYIYNLDYLDNSGATSQNNSHKSTKYSYLNKISLEAFKFSKNNDGKFKKSGNSEKYNPLLIEWTDEGQANFGNSIYHSGDYCIDQGYDNNYNNPRLTGDFNGDGRQDILGFDGGGFAFRVALSNGNGFNTSTEWATNYEDILPHCAVEAWYQNHINEDLLSMQEADKYVRIGDVNGDGMDDIVGFNYGNTIVLISTGSSFRFSESFHHYSEYHPTLYNEHRYDNKVVYLADANGDGRADIIVYSEDGVFVSLSQGTTFTNPDNWTSSFNGTGGWSNREKVKKTIGDFNGDGLIDLIGFGTDDTYVYTSDGVGSFNYAFQIPAYGSSDNWQEKYEGHYRNIREIADANGDGLSDIIAIDNDDVYVSLSTGVGFKPSTKWSTSMGFGDDNWGDFDDNGKSYSPTTKRTFADVNGDGKIDIVGFSKSGVVVGLSTGTSFNVDMINKWHIGYSSNAQWQHMNKNPRLVGDFNGDGSSDIIGFGQSRYCVAYSNKTSSRISKIKDSFGNKEEFEYSRLNNDDYYTIETNATYPIMDLHKPLSIIVNYRSGVYKHESSYKYTGAKVHLKGRGFMGFSEIETNTKSDFNNAMVTSTYIIKSEINTTHYYMHPYYSYSKGPNKETITKIIELNANNAYSFWHYPNKVHTLESIYNTDGTRSFKRSSLNTITLDNFGNATQTNSYISSNLTAPSTSLSAYQYKTSTNTTYKNINTSSLYILGLPLISETVNTTPNNANYSSKTQNIYLNQYSYKILQTTSTPNNNSSLAVINRIQTYDSYGNITRTQVGAITTLYEYESALIYGGRFLTKKTTEPYGLNAITTYEYNPANGTLLKSTDANGLTTTYDYNSFGSLQKTTHADGTKSHNVLRWAGYEDPPSGDEPKNCLYYSWTASSGNSPSASYFNKYSQNLRSVIRNFNGEKVFSDEIYDSSGRLVCSTGSYIKGQTPLNSTYYTYANYKLKFTRNNHVFTEIVNNGLSITENIFDANNPSAYSNNQTIQTKTKTFNILDQVISSTDNGGTIEYQYLSNGKPSSVVYDGTPTFFGYDDAGNRTYLEDPNAGTIETIYDAFGNLIYKKDARDFITEYQYDNLGRITIKTCPNINETTTYTYDNAINNSGTNAPTTKGLLAKVHQNNSDGDYIETYEYDAFNRKNQVTEDHNGRPFVYSYAYDNNGKLSRYYYPSGYSISNEYNTFGYLSKIIDPQNEKIIWQKHHENKFGQTTLYKLSNNTISVNKTYTVDGALKRIYSTKSSNIIQDLNYNFDPIKGNLISRKDKIFNMGEVFTYDNLDRLISSTVTDDNLNSIGAQTNNINYSNNGNITNKTNVGDYLYKSNKPNAVTSIENVVNIPSEENQITEFNHFNKISRIRHSSQNKEMRYQYNIHKQRSFTQYRDNNSGEYKTKYYVGGNYELEDNNGQERGLNYIYTPDGLVSIVETDKQNEIVATNYIYNDHLGSIYAITDKKGKIINHNDDMQIFSYDAWGNRRAYNKWTKSSTTKFYLFDRGYTGHQMLDEFDIIEMNGRIYDPVIGRFFSPDPFVQSPDNTQNFNRYSYVLNNPLKYTDPSGEFWHLVIGAAIGGVSNWAINGAQFNKQGLISFGVGAAVGAIGAGVSVGIQTAMAGASFGAGFVGSSQGISTILAVGYTSSVANGALVGAVGGYTSGFMSGTINGLLQGNNIGASLRMGYNTAGNSAFAGLLMGGLATGIGNSLQGKHFITGKKPFYEAKLDNYSVIRQSDNMNCKNATLESIEAMNGGSRDQVFFKKEGDAFLQTNPRATLEEYFEFFGFRIENPNNWTHKQIGKGMELGNPTVINENIRGGHTLTILKMRQWTPTSELKVWIGDPATTSKVWKSTWNSVVHPSFNQGNFLFKLN